MSPPPGETMDGTDYSVVDASGATEAIRHFREAIASGAHWYLALLEAIGLWDRPEEVYQGRRYRYLVGGEAFDWLLLAERLCEAADGAIPEQERLDLLFFARPPVEVNKETVRELIGSSKYRAYLNFLYGVLVEEALHLAVENEVRKEWGTSLFPRNERRLEDEVHERIYGASPDDLLARFRRERGYPHGDAITVEEMKEFTYWLFKLRLRESDKARVASDTRKGLEQLQRLRRPKGLDGGFSL